MDFHSLPLTQAARRGCTHEVRHFGKLFLGRNLREMVRVEGNPGRSPCCGRMATPVEQKPRMLRFGNLNGYSVRLLRIHCLG
ncbi:hypothetical protein SAMN06265222_102180 [Neorhodopirellula lusitana]|uniref:Transposase n=1 Tax=Neorhodopirellula lusitana TaxID=445327 RepID=A0ABY1PVU8_9BACT|nr:hypothetical protein SAMN06265222_102180 [Neorhodopirellula lusitana]